MGKYANGTNFLGTSLKIWLQTLISQQQCEKSSFFYHLFYDINDFPINKSEILTFVNNIVL